MSEALDHSQTTSHHIVNLAAMSLSAAPDLTEAERTIRSSIVIRGAMEFQPADTAQTILASLVLGHYLAIMDGFRDIACLTLNPAEVARARMVTVTRTKLVLQLLREMRIERREALTRAAANACEAAPGPAPEPVGDTAYESPLEASLAKFLSGYTETRAALEDTDTLTPAAAAKARETLSRVVSPALFAASGDANPVPAPVTGSRAQRRAMMKRNGGFKRHG
jgi:prolyl oligopeptidase PreP (S9A serine peptidase family)